MQLFNLTADILETLAFASDGFSFGKNRLNVSAILLSHINEVGKQARHGVYRSSKFSLLRANSQCNLDKKAAQAGAGSATKFAGKWTAPSRGVWEHQTMRLDLPTLMIMGSFISACAGVVLLVAWSQNQKEPVLAYWGIADLVFSGGIASVMLGAVSRQPAELALGGILLTFAPALVWKAARTIDAKATAPVLLFGGTIVVGLSSGIPVVKGLEGSLSLLIGATYLFAAAVTLWSGRKERLSARWPLIGFTVVNATILFIGAYSTLDGSIGQHQIPPLLSLFGLIHFEHNIFIVGTAVFVLALIKERNEMASRLAAQVDQLTGIANRGAFMDQANSVLERCQSEQAPVSLIMFDLDSFKTINDTYGHAAGDAVIKKFCEVVTNALRPNDIFGRIGGEEFAVVLAGSDIQAARARADRIRISFADTCHFVGSRQINATVTGGVSMSFNDEPTLSDLLQSADAALYLAKSEGRNRIIRADQCEVRDISPAVIRVA